MSVLRELHKKRKALDREWYSIRSLLGNDWAIFYFLLGGRETGKSYAATEFFVQQWRKYDRPFYWLRLTEASCKKLLTNNAEKLVDPDIRRRYNLELRTKGDGVYEVKLDEKGKVIEKRLMARVLALNTFYNDKGSGLFDKDFLDDPRMYYNICLDEFQPEKNEKRTFDVLYAFTNQLENLVRSTKRRIRVLCIGNTLEEAAEILCAFNFIPETFGRFYLKKKRCVIDYIEPSDKYRDRRKGTIADILMPTASTFTNEVKVDDSLVYKGRLSRPTYIIKFSKEKTDWYTIWDGNILAPYNGEQCTTVAMRPYIDDIFNSKLRDTIITMFDNRALMYKNLITFKKFQKEISLIKPRKG